MGETLADRAAKYFGIFQQPRRSISLGRSKVALFANDRLYVYDEYGWPCMAVVVSLTDNRRQALIDALERGMVYADA